MPRYSFLCIAVILAVIAVCCVSMQRAAPDPGGYRNLKVLPRNISSRDLNRIMVDDFEDGLGVSCTFCHAEDKATGKPDYADDTKPEKELARLMMKMTLGINKKYFKSRHRVLGDPMLVVSCGTCHQGKPHPDGSGE